MPLPSSIADLSQTAGSNSPAGSESPTTSDDYLRLYAAFIAQLRDGSGFTSGVLPRRGYLSGLILSNNGSDAVNDIDVALGECADSTNATFIRSTGTITKRLDAAWAAGTGNGGLDTGVIANTTYHVYAIKKDSDGTADALFSASASAPTMPSGYTYFRRVGSIVRAAATIKAFKQNGDDFRWDATVVDHSVANPGSAAVTRLLTVPTGIKVKVYGGVHINATDIVVLSDLAITDAAAGAGNVTLAAITAGGVQFQCWTNTSGQIRSRMSAGSAVTLTINTEGWMDNRGRLD